MADKDPYSEFKLGTASDATTTVATKGDDPYAEFKTASIGVPNTTETSPAPKPTFMDRISTEMNGGGAMLDPQKIVEGIGNSLGRTTKAWGDMFTGRAGPSTLPEMVPMVGPAAVDASRKLFTPGQRVEGATDAAMLLSPGLRELSESQPLNLAEGDVPSPGVVSRVGTGLKAAGPDLGKGAAKFGTAAVLDAATPAPFRIGTVVGTSRLAGSGVRQMGRGIATGYDAFRGPVEGPEVAPKGYALPYGAFNNYHPPMTPSEPLPNLGEQGMARQSIYTPAAPSPEPINRVSLPEGVNPPVERQTPAAPSPVVLSPSGSFGSGPQSGFSSASVRPATADEIAFENAPRRIVDPLESKIITPPPASVPETPAAYRARVTQSRSKFDANRKRN